MYTIEPYYNWRHHYIASEDECSPFFCREYSEFEFTHSVYDHFIHPQWDEIGTPTLFIKILYANYDSGHAIIEMIGEWNDCLYNDIMYLKRNIIESLQKQNINKYILIGENILNFHGGDSDYYEEWNDENEDGWIIGINFRDHVIKEFVDANLDYYICFGGRLNSFNWRVHEPLQLCRKIDELFQKRLTPHNYDEESDN